MLKTKRKIKVGPEDDGRRMRLADFDHAKVRDGYLYELSRGVITVSDIPNPGHFAIVNAIRMLLSAYGLANPNTIYAIGAGSDCKIMAWGFESERHPDIALYKSPPPVDDDEAWSIWIPDLVIEVVSKSSKRRDYHEKPEEYLAFGVREYWIVDAEKQQVLVLQRHGGTWKERIVRASEVYKPKLLPGFELSVSRIFSAVKPAKK